MKRFQFFLIVLSVVSFSGVQPLFSESPYDLSLGKESLWTAAALGSVVMPYLLSPAVTEQPDRTRLLTPDRFLMRPYDPTLDRTGTVLACGALMLPGLSAWGNGWDPETMIIHGVMYTEAFLLTHGTKELLKTVVSRWRPSSYFEGAPSEDQQNSFPSGHTAYAFLGASFFSTILRQQFPEERWTTVGSALAYSLAGSTAVLRVLSGEHFISDVLAGAVIGTAFGVLVPTLHLRKKEDSPSLVVGSQQGETLLMLQFSW